MKRFVQNLYNDVRNLICGRPVNVELIQRQVPKKITVVEIHKSSKSNRPHQSISREEQLNIMLRSINSQMSDKVIVLPFDDPSLLAEFTNRNRSVIFTYILKRLTHAINQNWSAVTLFQFSNSDTLAQIKQTFYKDQLVTLMDWFVKIENYESAAQCRELIKQLNTA